MNVSELRPARPLVWINGFPGTGKYTIAKHLTTLLHDYSPLLIDNHSLIDPVEAEFSREDPNYQLERRRGRETVFKNVVQDAAVRTRNLIFTGELTKRIDTSIDLYLIQFVFHRFSIR